ncbi:hypothetical protein EX895_000964 [Sporisorium graminicola]|uniref:Mid2 domain-containing protein n=1 Tax=Sporisorium graminicola TaxID=280036 RepID=A0A4U7L2E1_9BASI|nr:hypothetical protein EX895_000964 [Sporisorium graminicola]TKY90966.1 hypothetical protein EX895_000964 [Sporisorium graminicola]
MVGVKKFSALAAVSAVAVTGAAASLQPADASHAHHQLLSHRGLAERQLHNQQQSPSMVKMQKRLAHTIVDGLGGIIGGLGTDLGFNELDEAEQRLHNLRRGLVGELLGAGGQAQGGAPPSSSSSRAPAPASTSRPPSNNAPASSSNAPEASRPAASSNPAPASSPAANNSNNANNNRPSSPSSSNTSSSNNNNAASNQESTASQNNNNNANTGDNRGTAQQQAAASNGASAAPTGANSAAAAASASASAAAASALSAASASQPSGDAAVSAAAASLGRAATGAAPSAAATGSNRANSSGSSNGSDGTTKVVVPIVVIAASIAVIAVAWTVIRRVRKRSAEHYDPRMQSVESSYHHRSMMGPPLAAGGAAFAVGGAAAGLVRDRPRRDSYESYHQGGRPMSTLTEEEGDFSGVPPPMQEVATFSAIGGATAAPSSRLRNYGSTRGGNAREQDDEFPPAHRITDSMFIDNNPSGAVTPFSDEHGAYDVNYYDGSSTGAYNNRATRGMDAAGVSSGAGRSYSPYADVQRSETGDEKYYDYDRASSSRQDPFSNSSRWSG